MNGAPDTTRLLAHYMAGAQIKDVSDAVRHESRRAFLNILGCMLGGSQRETVAVMKSAFAPFFGSADATLIGLAGKADPLHASYINCLSSSVDSFDDNHADMIVHPAGPAASGILALSETRHVTGAQALQAFALGMETMCRLCRSISVAPARASLAWVQTGIVGGMGAAVSAGKILGLDPQRMTWAIGIANSQAAGFRGNHGTMCTPLMPAQTARSGLEAALLAERGFTSSDTSLEAKFGFCNVFSEEPNANAIVEGLGTSFDMLGITYKPYPSGVVLNPVIEACLALARENQIDAQAIAKIHVTANPTAVSITDRRQPADPMAAQLSIQHWSAVAIATGRATADELSPAKISNPVISVLKDRVEMLADPLTSQDAATVTVTFNDGRTIKKHIEHCIGGGKRPMSDRELEDKFRDQARPLKSEKEIAKLIDLCWRLDQLDDVSVIAKAAA